MTVRVRCECVAASAQVRAYVCAPALTKPALCVSPFVCCSFSTVLYKHVLGDKDTFGFAAAMAGKLHELYAVAIPPAAAFSDEVGNEKVVRDKAYLGYVLLQWRQHRHARQALRARMSRFLQLQTRRRHQPAAMLLSRHVRLATSAPEC